MNSPPLTQYTKEYQEKQEMVNVIDLDQESQTASPDDWDLSDCSGLLASGEKMRAPHEQPYDPQEDEECEQDQNMEVDDEDNSKALNMELQKHITIVQCNQMLLKKSCEIQKNLYLKFKHDSEQRLKIMSKLVQQLSITNTAINNIQKQLTQSNEEFIKMFKNLQKQIEAIKTTKKMNEIFPF